MILEEQLSKIEHLFLNYKDNISILQDTQFCFLLKGYNEKLIKGKEIVIETNLIDYYHSQIALLIGRAAVQLKQYLNQLGSDDGKSIVLQLNKWKLVFLDKFKSYVVIILDCNYLGNSEIILDLSTFNPDIHLNETKKIKYTILKTNLNKPKQDVEPQTFKKLKIENHIYSKTNQHSIIFDENLINSSLIDISFNRSYFKQHQDYNTIKDLFVNNKKSWVLEARIIEKSDMLEFKKKDSNIIANYFKIIILDKDQEIIAGLFFDKSNAKMFNYLEKGKVYLFRNGSISKVKQIYPKSITFTQYSIIQESQNHEFPTLPILSLKKIYDIQNQPLESIIDLVGAIQEIKTISDICLQLIVLDQTGRIVIKLFGKQYSSQEFKQGQILIFKGMNLKNHQNFLFLCSNQNTLILHHQNYEEVQILRNWLQDKDIDQIMKPKEDCLTLNLLQLEEFIFKKLDKGRTNKVDTVFVIGYLTELQKVIYPRCPSNKCLSKMEHVLERQTYKCKRCLIENNSPQQSFILNVKIMDEYNQIEAIIFNDYAEELLGITADEFSHLTMSEQNMILSVSRFRQQRIKLKIIFNEYKGSIRPQYKVVEINDVDYKALAQKEMLKLEELDYLLNVSQIL